MNDFFEIEAAIRLSRCKGIGASMFKTLINKYKKPTIALEEWKKNQIKYRNPAVSEKKNNTEESISETLKGLINKDFQAFYYGQSSYPSQLNSLTEPPPIIYLSSYLKEIPLAAVVGSRMPSLEQIELARKYTLNLIKEGYGIVSGGAIGIDKTAHETALQANAYTLAVLANGLDVIYPKKNKELFEKIKNKGVLMTELMIGAQPQKGFFPTRNRLIAAMAEIVVVLPSSCSSGSLITAKWAKKLGKKLIYE